MFAVEARNPHAALPQALEMIYRFGVREDSRNGPVYRMPAPVVTVYSNPWERLVFHPWRDDNPFFLNLEALWMLAGREDLAPLSAIVKNMANYSDDGGVTSPGAYGKRWRDWHVGLGDHNGYEWPDQLNWAVKRLLANPADRRVVIQMWDPAVDIERADNGGKDVPCNLMIMPWISEGFLHLTVINRSNDIIWGLYSANAVQFSTLLQYLAVRLRLPMGTLTTFSNNFHAYEATIPKQDRLNVLTACPYSQLQGALTAPHLGDLWNDPHCREDAWAERIFQEDLAMLFEYPTAETQLKARSAYIRNVACPMLLAHQHYKKTKGAERFSGALEILAQIPANADWRVAGEAWIGRRAAETAAKAGAVA